MVFGPQETTKDIDITVIDDALNEADETVYIRLDTPTNAILGPTSFHTLTILDNDAMPTVEFDAATSVEDESAGQLGLYVSLSAVSGQTVTVDYVASGGTATDGTDYDSCILNFQTWSDDFNDSDITDWTAAPGWTALNGYLENTGATASIYKVQPNNNFQMTFNYQSDNSSPTVIRFRQDYNDDWLELNIDWSENLWEIYENVDGVSSLKDTATVTNDTNTWYEVYIRCVGASVEIWRKIAASPDARTLLLSFMNSTVTASDTFLIEAASGFLFDDLNVFPVTACQLIFAPGEITKCIPLYLTDDTLDEDDETVELTILSPMNAVLGATDVHILTVTDDDLPPTVAFTAAASSDVESVTARSVTVALSAASGYQITVPYIVSGTATSGTDYSIDVADASPFVFYAGDTTKTLDITVVEEALNEAPETVVVTLGTPTSASLGAIPEHTLTIENDDITVGFSAAENGADEAAGTLTIPVVLSAAAMHDLSIPYTVSGTAADGADYTIDASPLQIPTGQTGGNISVSVTDDSPDEDDETIVITLLPPQNVVLGATTTHTLTITDNDAPPSVAFDLESSEEEESVAGRTATLTLSAISEKTVTVPYALAGTAETGADYTIDAADSSPLVLAPGETSKTIDLTVVEETLSEDDETVILTLGTPANATLGATTVHTVTIVDNDPSAVLSFSQSASSIDESGATASIEIILSESAGKTITVPFAVSGTAVDGTDYSIDPADASPITFAPGETSRSIDVTVADDQLNEADETVIITLGAPTNALAGGTMEHTLSIANNDAEPTVTFAAATQTDGESVVNRSATVQLSEESGQTVEVPYTVSGSAENGVDYSIDGGSVSPLIFAPGETGKTITITLTDDLLDEMDETVVLTMGALVNAAAGTSTEHTLTIVDDDLTPTVGFGTSSSTVNENQGTANLVVNLTAASGLTVSVPYTVTASAEDGVDYTIATGPLTFTPGTTSQNIALTLIDDTLDEATETIEVHLGTPENADLGAATDHIVMLVDDDSPPTVQFAQTGSILDESAGAASVTVTVSTESSLEIQVPYTLAGTALPGLDYVLAAGSLQFDAGVVSQTIEIGVLEDVLNEVTETVELILGMPTNASLGATSLYTLSIADNDPVPEVAFSQTSSRAPEYAGTVNLTITLSAESGQTVTVPVDLSGTASEGADYTTGANPVVFSPGTTSQDFALLLTEDELPEGDETVLAALGAPANAVAGTNNSHEFTIRDNDVPLPDVYVSQITSPIAGTKVKRGETINVTFTISNSGMSDALAGAWMSALYLSRGSTIGQEPMKLLALVPGPDVLAGNSATQNIAYTVDDFAPGRYYLIVQSDAQDCYLEVDEFNELSVETVVLDEVFTNE